MVCTFLGHRDASLILKPLIKEVLEDLIKNKNVEIFYIGNQGNFDFMVVSLLKELKKYHSHIQYYVVSAYFPKNSGEKIIYPEGLETVPVRFAIPWRNKWMINKSDYVVTYVTHS